MAKLKLDPPRDLFPTEDNPCVEGWKLTLWQSGTWEVIPAWMEKGKYGYEKGLLRYVEAPGCESIGLYSTELKALQAAKNYYREKYEELESEINRRIDLTTTTEQEQKK